MWNVTWRIYIRIAFFLACVNVFAAGKRKQMMSHVLTFGSLMFGALAVLTELKMVNVWYEFGEAVELEMLPKIYHRLTIEIPSLLLLNLIPLFILFLLKKKRYREAFYIGGNPYEHSGP